jgi:nucleoside-diphosphate-sugar epimerase
MKRVLVTGGSGFIGAPAVASLAGRPDVEVHAVSRRLPAEPVPAGVRWTAADVFDRGQMRALFEAVRPTHLLHLAWAVEPGVFWTSPENRAWADASVALFRDFASAGGERIVGAGSCSEYAWDDAPLGERTSAERPASPYGEAKLAAWRGLESAARETGISAAWGRVFLLYGPREHPKRLVSSVIRAVLLGQRAPATEGSQRRDFLHVDDVGSAMAAILDSEARGPVNIASGAAVSVRDVVTKIARAIGREDLLDVGALPSRPDEPAVVEGRNERLRSETGWRPRFGLDSGIDHTISWWKRALGRE